jgi:2-polyprenyl-3-methyl-5-hydroxy-6-metoxy-1,4-benzoquinol methylase
LISNERRLLADLAKEYENSLWEIKLAHRAKSFWYPYPTLQNIPILERLLATVGLDLLQLCRGSHGKIADIGSADADLAFFMEKMGFSVDVIENRLTNFNLLEGARVMKEALKSSVIIREADLDSQFPLSSEKYDAIFFLGILYHLKNPFFILERLARMTKYCFLSTRIASQTADGHSMSPYPLVYLLDPQECNNDSTNFWIFSDQGLKRLIKRTGWNLIAYTTIGNTTDSNPADPDKDQRAFCVLQSGHLTATPSPVVAKDSLGATTVSWSTGTGQVGQVFVACDGGEEKLLAERAAGTQLVPWIKAGSTYRFSLYEGTDQTTLLASIEVEGVSTK